MPNWRKGVQGPQRKPKRKFKRRPAKRRVDRRQNKDIMRLYSLIKYSKERKFIDQNIPNLSLASSWVNPLPRDLTYIQQGSGENQRVGNKIKIHSHHLKVIMTVGDATNLYRLMVVRFSHESASLVQLSDALSDPTAGTPLQLMSFKKRNTDSKYQILYDSGVKQLAGNGSAASPSQASSQRIHNIVVSNGNKGWYAGYNATGPAACVAGFTYLVVCTDSAIAPSPSISCLARTVFSG